MRSEGEAPPFRVELIESSDRLEALAVDWDALVARVSDFSAAQTFNYAVSGWACLPKDRNRSLKCIAIWSGARLVGMWPFYVRRHLFWTIACPLGCGGNEEYGGPVLQEGARADELARVAIESVRKVADVVKVFNVKAAEGGGRLQPAIERSRAFRHSWSMHSPVIDFAGYSEWDAWYMTLSKSLRTGQRYDRKRLAKMGDLRFAEISETAERQNVVSWIFRTKRAWLVAGGRKSHWVDRDECRLFFELASKSRTGSGHVRIFALTLDGEIVAAVIALTSKKMFEFYMTTFNESYRLYSPGKLLLEDCARWSFEHGLILDLRLTNESYKGRWATARQRYDSYVLANSMRGLPYVFMEVATARTKELRQRMQIKSRIRAVMACGITAKNRILAH